jgi:hypothetical protein
MATNTVDQSRLVLNAFAAYFQNNLLAADLVTWNQFSGEMNDRNQLQVSEQVGPSYVVTQTTSGVQDLTTGVQNSVFGSETFTVKDVFGASMGWSDFVAIRDMGDARRSEALRRAAVKLAETIDGYILRMAAQCANNEVGTAGNNVATLADVLTAHTRIKKEGVDDSDLRLVLSYDDQQALASTVVALSAPDSMVTSTFRQGFAGTIGGIPAMYTQQLSNITPGTRTNGAVNGASQNVHYKDVCISTTNGRYLTQTIAADGFGANATIKDGEIFTIATVFAYDNRLHQAHSHLQQFRVIGDTVADGTGAVAALRIFPAMIVDDGSSIIGDAAADRAHATVGSAPADNAVITWRGTASTAYKPRVLLNKNAVICNTADLIMPATGEASRVSLTKVPLSVRMWKDSTFTTGEHRVRFDVAVTANTRERRNAVRLNGS